MADQRPSSFPAGDPQPIAEAEPTPSVTVGRASRRPGRRPRPVRPSSLLSERLRRPETAGRFVITGEIARGGMGIIYRGHDPDLGRDLAIKVLKPEWADQPDLVAMFLGRPASAAGSSTPASCRSTRSDRWPTARRSSP